MRVVAYFRVSTTKQAEKQLSIPDQRRQVEERCKAQGWDLVREFVEPGASATDDKRPAFQEMIRYATSTERPVDVVLVHSFSRFFRDSFKFEFYRRKLQKAGVSVVSLTQAVPDDPQGDLIRSVLTSFDSYSSAENAKHVKRCMIENARMGFWNGSKPPFGYGTEVAEYRGDTAKKVLKINDEEAETVRLIFDLFQKGVTGRGPMGVKAVVSYLNERGYTHRGRKFHVSSVHAILTRQTYAGTHHFNKRDSKTGKPRPPSEWVSMASPVIIEESRFNAVQRLLKSRNPKKTPSRVVSGPILLTGLLKCSSCGGGMTLRTGKSGQYKYYACATAAHAGKSECKGRSAPMQKIDDLVLGELQRNVFAPDRLQTLVGNLANRSEKGRETAQEHLRKQRKEASEAASALDRLYQAIEAGIVDLDDPQFRQRVEALKLRRDETAEDVKALEKRVNTGGVDLSPEKLQAFSNAVKERLRNGDPAFRRAYLRLFVDQVELSDDAITIQGPKGALMQALGTDGDFTGTMVPSCDREWRARQDSNLRPPD